MTSFSALWRSLDIYGHPVGVTYKGKDTYQTKLGALFSFFTYILVIFYAAEKMLLLIGKSQPDRSIVTEVENLILSN